MNIEELKNEAIQIIDDPNTDPKWKQWALNFAERYIKQR